MLGMAYSVRDLLGHFVRPRSARGKMCPHACCRNKRVHPATYAEVRQLNVRTARVRTGLDQDQLARRMRASWVTVRGFGRQSPALNEVDAD